MILSQAPSGQEKEISSGEMYFALETGIGEIEKKL